MVVSYKKRVLCDEMILKGWNGLLSLNKVQFFVMDLEKDNKKVQPFVSMKVKNYT